MAACAPLQLLRTLLDGVVHTREIRLYNKFGALVLYNRFMMLRQDRCDFGLIR